MKQHLSQSTTKNPGYPTQTSANSKLNPVAVVADGGTEEVIGIEEVIGVDAADDIEVVVLVVGVNVPVHLAAVPAHTHNESEQEGDPAHTPVAEVVETHNGAEEAHGVAAAVAGGAKVAVLRKPWGDCTGGFHLVPE